MSSVCSLCSASDGCIATRRSSTASSAAFCTTSTPRSCARAARWCRCPSTWTFGRVNSSSENKWFELDASTYCQASRERVAMHADNGFSVAKIRLELTYTLCISFHGLNTTYSIDSKLVVWRLINAPLMGSSEKYERRDLSHSRVSEAHYMTVHARAKIMAALSPADGFVDFFGFASFASTDAGAVAGVVVGIAGVLPYVIATR